MARYELWYADEQGARIAPIRDVASFEYVMVIGDVGMARFDFPPHGQLYDNRIADRRVHIYRQPWGGAMSLALSVFLDRFQISTSSSGLTLRSSTGADPNDLLRRRITAYYASSAQTSMSGTADDMMKAIVTDNLVDNADYSGTPSPPRDIDDHGFSVAPATSDGPALSKGFSWRNVLRVLQDLQAASKSEGTEVFFGVVPTSETTLQFRTWTGQPGADRTITSGANPVIFSLAWGNLANPRLSYDYNQSANQIYAGGQGDESNRVVAQAQDLARIQSGSFARREAFYLASQQSTAASVADAAADELARNRPRLILTADLLDTPLAPFGGLSGWKAGDRVTVSYAGYSVDTIIRSVRVKVDGRGNETVTARIEDTVTT